MEWSLNMHQSFENIKPLPRPPEKHKLVNTIFHALSETGHCQEDHRPVAWILRRKFLVEIYERANNLIATVAPVANGKIDNNNNNNLQYYASMTRTTSYFACSIHKFTTHQLSLYWIIAIQIILKIFRPLCFFCLLVIIFWKPVVVRKQFVCVWNDAVLLDILVIIVVFRIFHL